MNPCKSAGQAKPGPSAVRLAAPFAVSCASFLQENFFLQLAVPFIFQGESPRITGREINSNTSTSPKVKHWLVHRVTARAGLP